MHRKLKQSLSVILSIGLVLLAQFVMARAGGGGGHGGGFHSSGSHSRGRGGGHDPLSIVYIILYVTGSVGAGIIFYYKVLRGKRVMKKASVQEPIWDSSYVESYTKDVFMKMQDAWENRDMDRVREIISDELYNEYKVEMDILLENKRKNIIVVKQIYNVDIISALDYKENSRDEYKAYITGIIQDYTISEITNNVINNVSKADEEFKDIYHFVRRGDKWILSYIDNNPDFFDISNAKNYREA